MADLFEYRDYKSYLRDLIHGMPNAGRGVRLNLAKAVGCPVSHISQVLSGKFHFSFEQAEGANLFFGHTEEEARFFLLLVQLARAGTPHLRRRIEAQVQEIFERRLVLKERLGVKTTVRPEDQATFYSSWIHGAIHVMVSIPRFQTKEAISKYLGISLKRVNEILDFLVSTGLIVKRENGTYTIGTGRIHLGADSPMISKFHTNWRMKAIQSLEEEDAAEDLHYSSVVTISEADREKIKSLLVKYIAEIKAIIKESPEEGVHSFSLDFFRI